MNSTHSAYTYFVSVTDSEDDITKTLTAYSTICSKTETSFFSSKLTGCAKK